MNAAVVFVRVAQAGSFRGASKSLGMPKTSVSRRVAELETRLGVQLLRRTTRQVALTDAGLAYVEAAQSAIAHLEAAEEAVSRQQREPRGRVRVTAPSPLGHAVLAAHLAEFLRLHPKVEVEFHLTYRPVDLLTERFDVALRYGVLPDSSLVAVPLGTSEQRIVASPTYLESHPAPHAPADLADHECLLFGVQGPSLPVAPARGPPHLVQELHPRDGDLRASRRHQREREQPLQGRHREWAAGRTVTPRLASLMRV